MSELDQPRKTVLPAQRQSELVKLLEIKGQMLVSEISDYFDVSEDTVRRDLDALAQKGALTRTHGGAVTISALPRRNPLEFQLLQRISMVATGTIDDSLPSLGPHPVMVSF